MFLVTAKIAILITKKSVVCLLFILKFSLVVDQSFTALLQDVSGIFSKIMTIQEFQRRRWLYTLLKAEEGARACAISLLCCTSKELSPRGTWMSNQSMLRTPAAGALGLWLCYPHVSVLPRSPCWVFEVQMGI